ncbi:MAG: phage terminase large subunit [Oscillospiraceae bacterium]|nr:phage terminase large subunit [Oscillospiraceae bacterium]
MGSPATPPQSNDAARRIRSELVQRELARRNYGWFLRLTGGAAWIPTRFSDFLARETQAFLEADSGDAYDILILQTPPQHGKSMSVTEALPAWVLMRKPETRVILASYNEDSAERFARRNREKLSQWGPLLFDVAPGGVNRATEYEIAGHRGRLISRGIMSGITGNAADLLIIDDPIKNREEADSPAYREKLWAEWLNSLKSRLAAHAKVILIMTPWHEDDLSARIRRTETNVRLLRLPVEAEASDPLGRAPGAALCPELGKGDKWLAQFRQSYLNDPSGGQRAWMALYQCRPRSERGNIVRRDWWKFYETLPDAFGTQCISVDAAFKGGENNDFVAITVWGRRDSDYFLLDCLNSHMDFVGTLAAIRETRRKYPDARAVLIEDKANGSAILNVLQREMFCVPVDPRGDKRSRVYGASPAIESGHVYVPRSAAWLEEYLDQWTAFPSGRHDDMVDSSTQALHWLFEKSGEVPETPEEIPRERAREEYEAALTDNECYDIYNAW